MVKWCMNDMVIVLWHFSMTISNFLSAYVICPLSHHSPCITLAINLACIQPRICLTLTFSHLQSLSIALKIFISSLLYSHLFSTLTYSHPYFFISTEDIVSEFSKYGVIGDVYRPTDMSSTLKERSFLFIRYFSEIDATEAQVLFLFFWYYNL